MIPYLENGSGLEKLLENLFEDEEEDIAILKIGFHPPQIFTSCCTYNYGGFN